MHERCMSLLAVGVTFKFGYSIDVGFQQELL